MTMLPERHVIDYGILHTCTLDSMGHRFGHDCIEVGNAYAMMLPRWLENGYEVILTADHGQSDRGHHGERSEDQQDVALYWFGGGEGPSEKDVLDQLQLAPTILHRMRVPIPKSMKAKPFLS